MKINIEKYFNEFIDKTSKDLIYRDAGINQIGFIKHFCKKFSILKNCFVVSEHFSKSVALPVYKIEYSGYTIYMRNNFYNWILTIESDKELKLPEILIKNESKLYYIEGFKEEWQANPYEKGCKKCSIEINDDYDLYVILFNLFFNN